jgi:hypothetical protein
VPRGDRAIEILVGIVTAAAGACVIVGVAKDARGWYIAAGSSFAAAVLLWLFYFPLHSLTMKASSHRSAVQQDRELGRRIAEQLQKPMSLTIIDAAYGVPGKPDGEVDVTSAIQAAVTDGRLNVLVSNALAPVDPAINEHKSLTIRYSLDGREMPTCIFRENEQAVLP